MKAFLLTILLATFQHLLAQQISENPLLVLDRDVLYLYDPATSERTTIQELNKIGYWRIGKVTLVNDTVKLLLYDGLALLNFALDGAINEKMLELSSLNYKIITERNSRTFTRGNLVFCEIEKDAQIEIPPNQFNERYRYVNTKCFSNEGDLYVTDNNERKLFIQRQIVDKITCGYYDPDMTFDGKMLVCENSCSKHSRKVLIGLREIVEIEISSKTIIKLPIFGHNPTYSKDGSILLYRQGREYFLFYKNTGQNVQLKGITQAVWVK